MGLPFGRRAIQTGSDTHAASLTGSDTHALATGATAEGVVLYNVDATFTTWSGNLGTTTTNLVSTTATGLQSANHVISIASISGAKVTATGNVSGAVLIDASTIVGSETITNLLTNSSFTMVFEATRYNVTANTLTLQVNASNNGVNIMSGTLLTREVYQSGSDTHGASLTGSNTQACELRF